MRKFWFMLLVLGLAINIGIACGDDDDDDNDDDNDDSSGDTDTDSDGDSDGDSDSDSDSDGDCPECVMNSGYPCGCNAEACDDGSICGTFTSGDTAGGCFKPCTSGADCAADDYAGCAGIGDCVLQDTGSGDQYCGFTCTGDTDCPGGTYCNTAIGIGVCYGEG